MKKNQMIKKDYGVYEHLEHHVKKTTYAHRWKLLEEMNGFANKIEEARRKNKLFKK